MARAKKSPPKHGVEADPDFEPEAPPPFAPRSPTTDMVAAALRRNLVTNGREQAREQLIDALCGALLFSIELDGPAATMTLLGDAFATLRRGYWPPRWMN